MNFLSQANQVLSLLASIATAIGVYLVYLQLRQSRIQSMTDFEDNLVQQYREIIKSIPIEALLGERITHEKSQASLDCFYQYIELSNEQIFLRQEGRVRKETWENWQDGMRSHLSRPAFRKAWEEVKQRSPNSFTELRKLEKHNFRDDPWLWHQCKWKGRLSLLTAIFSLRS